MRKKIFVKSPILMKNNARYRKILINTNENPNHRDSRGYIKNFKK